MDGRDGDLDEAWPDRSKWNRWRDALAAAAERLHEERGIDEPWRLTVDWGALWVEYGERPVRVSGADSEELEPEGLFEELDGWVAFGRMAGPVGSSSATGRRRPSGGNGYPKCVSSGRTSPVKCSAMSR